MTTTDTDRIEKTVVLRAPRARVWRALSDSGELGEWFGVKLDGPFVAGERIAGTMAVPGTEHLTFEAFIEQMDPERLFSFRWHPYAIDPAKDYSGESTTLVEIRLEDAPDGTRLTVVESGFDSLPEERRDEAYRMNSGGWSAQAENIRRHVEG